MFIPGCQRVEIEENCERFVASTKRKFLSFEKLEEVIMKVNRFVLYSLFLIFICVCLSCQSDKYKEGSTYFGFKLIEKRFVKEVNSDCYLFEHVESGARLLKFAADDANKTFCIAFKTTPESDCGTPHIIEHSLLNGSKNFPVKSPIDVLRKGSLNTFLNALTGNDVTLYPVASMNNKDYFNLMHVYLDAVFYPLIYDDPRILKQEGWHHELANKDASVIYKGVVYNEMKGGFSRPTSELSYLVYKNLFPDNCYGFSSVGYPAAIPTLTYKKFLDFHRKYYHPSNSYIFLYGDADLDEELSFINEKYLSNYEKSADIASISLQKPFKLMKKVNGCYPVPEEGSTENKTYLSLSWVIGEGKDQVLGMALDVLSDALVNHESGPIRIALQEAGIGRDVSSYYDGKKQNVLLIWVQNANASDKDKFYNIVKKTLLETAEKGIDKEIIKGIINRKEFSLREGEDPAQKGLISIWKAHSGWFYADDPFLSLEWEKPLNKIKTALENDLLETIIKEQMLNNPHSLLLTLKPKRGLETERNKKINAECAKYKATLSEKEIETLVKETKELIKYQEREDSPEALATIPLLELKDINPEAKWHPITEKKVDEVPVLYFNAFTNNVVYTNLLFDARVLPKNMIPYASLLTEFLGSLNTENYTYGDLDNELNIHTGGFNANLNTYLENRKDENMMPKFVVFSKAMNTKVDKLFELNEEIINHTIFSDKERIKTVLTRHKSRLDASIIRGYSYARTRLTSYYSNKGIFDELTKGIEYYWFVTDLVNNFDKNADEIIANLKKAASKLFTKDNLIVTVTSGKDDLFNFNKELGQFLTLLSKDKVEKENWKFVFDNKNEGFLTTSKVQYVLKGYDYKKLGYDWNGKIRVMNQVLRSEWLRNQIRVIGGAYEVYLSIPPSGLAYFASFYDPNLKETIDNFDGSPEFLSKFEPDEDAMTRFIIGTIASMDRPRDPSEEGNVAVRRHLEKTTQENVQKERDEVLSTTPEDVREMSKLVTDILAQNAICVYGNEEKVKSNKDLFKKVMKLDK